MSTAIEIINLSKEIENQVILKCINMKIKKGEIYGLLGANGAGKTTLMKTLFNIIKPSEGEVILMGKKVTNDKNNIFKNIGSIIEIPIFYQAMTVMENLNLHCDYVDPAYKSEINAMLSLVGLENASSKKVRDLSLGMKQRLALGRAFLCKPDILILDEPINGLDPKGIVDIRELIIKLNKEQGITIFISSHIISELSKISDTIGILDNGQLIEELSMKNIIENNIDLESYFLKILNRGVC